MKTIKYCKMAFFRKTFYLISLNIVLILSSSLAYSDNTAKYTCTSSYKNKSVSRSEIESLLQLRISERNSTQYINLCGSFLKNIDLSTMDLSYIDFSDANLTNTNLTNSNLSNCLFKNANLYKANLTNVFLQLAVLTNANIQEAILNKANINYANLDHVNLERSSIKNADLQNSSLKSAKLLLVNLQGSNLTESDLSDSDLTNAMMEEVNFTRANLQDAILIEANLEEANFTNADLSEAKLNSSSLEKAKFINSILKNTDFTQADFNQAVYKPNPTPLPDIISIASSKNFNKIKFYDKQLGAPALISLRNAYMSSGMKSMEQLITSMVKTEDMKKAWKTGGWGYLEAFFSYFLFYLTSNFGESPGKPLRIFLALIFLCAIPYTIAIRNPSSNCRIYKVITDELSKEKTSIELLTYTPPLKFLHKILYEIKQIALVLHISLLTSFQIGFQHFNISDWLSRAHSKPYHFVMSGWIRSIAGVQSLLSLYLVILWALTYFGHPFSW